MKNSTLAIMDILVTIKEELAALREDTQDVKRELETVREDTQDIRRELETVKEDTHSMRDDTQYIKTDVESLRQNTDAALQDLKMDLNQDTNSTLMDLATLREDTQDVKMDLATLREDTNSRMQDLQEGLATLRQEGSQERAEVNATVSKIQETVEEDNLIMNSVRDASQKHQQFTTEQFSNISEEIQDIQQSFQGLASQCDTSSAVTECDPLISVQYLPTSCSELAASSPSGYYWVRSSNGSAVNVYCDMARHCCGSTGGWMRVAYLDMTDTSQQCPEGFRLITEPKRTCELIVTNGCTSILYHSHHIQYSKVCGRARAYQYYQTIAFYWYDRDYGTTIDSNYVSGMSITHGESPRKHIWTFAAAIDETYSNEYVCPCTKTDTPYTGRVPPFIGNDYFCDTGSRERNELRYYWEDPLWDGEGCGPTSSCCQFNSPPWFCKELPQPTTDDVEVRVCTWSQQYRDTPFDLIELYIQ